MRVPNATHEAGPWRIHEILPDFTLEDAWELPAEGDREDFAALVELTAASDPANAESAPARALWRLRERLGEWFDLGGISAPADGSDALPVPGTSEDSVAGRLPDDLLGSAADVHFVALPFVPLYRTEDEFAAEISNRTVHGVMHLAWVELDGGRYRGQMAVYVRPRGRFGQAYMALIGPFRHLIVYPTLLKQTARTWERRPRRSS